MGTDLTTRSVAIFAWLMMVMAVGMMTVVDTSQQEIANLTNTLIPHVKVFAFKVHA